MRTGTKGVVAAVLALVTSVGCEMNEPDRSTPTAAAPSDLPRSMVALGDSMTRAFLLCDDFGDCPEASWSTGSSEEIDSHAARISKASGHKVTARNVAVSGATVSGLESQVRAALQQNVDYATVLIGANDACAPSETSMTPLATFETTFARALDALARGMPDARILVVSIPDLMHLWEVGKDRPDVRAVWGVGICQSMLANPLDTSATANDRRARVRARVQDYNDAMAKACAQHPNCRWDGSDVFDYRFTLDHVSDRDFWHPSRVGQRTMSRVAWDAGYWPLV